MVEKEVAVTDFIGNGKDSSTASGFGQPRLELSVKRAVIRMKGNAS
jgi:hypothetical protein